MKIILTTTSPDIDSAVDPRFGRGAYLTVVDGDTLDWKAYPNPGVGATGGAGVQAAQFAAAQKASAVISGDFGPNAFDTLQAAGIAMYLYPPGATTARSVVEQFKAQTLKPAGAATRPGHHG